MVFVFSFEVKKYKAKNIVKTEKKRIKCAVFKIAAKIVPKIIPITTKAPKLLTILKKPFYWVLLMTLIVS